MEEMSSVAMICLMLSLKQITLIVFLINIILTAYTVFIFFIVKLPSTKQVTTSIDNGQHVVNGIADSDEQWDQWTYNKEPVHAHTIHRSIEHGSNVTIDQKSAPVTIEIWSKAAIGLYLWEHVLKGKIDKNIDGGVYTYGFKRINDIKLKFRSGPMVTVYSLRQFLLQSTGRTHLILVLNGRTKENVNHAKIWLNELKLIKKDKKISVPLFFGAMLLGNENCFNSWIQPYLQNNGGPLNFLFVVYDWDQVDDEYIFQWPLGVATYRNFPITDPTKLNIHLTRPYICNFLGTIYPNSSRSQMMAVLNQIPFKSKCFIKPRLEWQPNESKESLEVYLESLRLSDVTLNPIGMNHECYRIYEALSFGSVPILEENRDHMKGKRSSCDKGSAYRMLKRYDAPVIYISNWTLELGSLLEDEMRMPDELRLRRRFKLIKWYSQFKIKLKDQFLRVIDTKFRKKQ